MAGLARRKRGPDDLREVPARQLVPVPLSGDLHLSDGERGSRRDGRIRPRYMPGLTIFLHVLTGFCEKPAGFQDFSVVLRRRRIAVFGRVREAEKGVRRAAD